MTILQTAFSQFNAPDTYFKFGLVVLAFVWFCSLFGPAFFRIDATLGKLSLSARPRFTVTVLAPCLLMCAGLKGKLLSILQEFWGNKFFGKGGRESAKSAKNAERNNECTVIKDNEVGTDPKGKSPSKHQLKSAKRAERVSGTVRPGIWTLEGGTWVLPYNRGFCIAFELLPKVAISRFLVSFKKSRKRCQFHKIHYKVQVMSWEKYSKTCLFSFLYQ